LRDVAAWMPKNAILNGESLPSRSGGAGTIDIGLTQLKNVANTQIAAPARRAAAVIRRR
jgi:hypothetical protein